jgi:hypothetical protein
MKTLVRTLLILSAFTSAALAFDTDYKTRIISSATLTIHVKDGQFVVIRNFTQDQDVGLRGIVTAGLPAPSATPTPTPNPTPTPSTVDLTATKTHSPAGAITFPNTWTWTIRVANSGNTAATFSLFATILTDNLPNTNIGYNSLSVTGTNSSQIFCGITNFDLTCTATNTITFNPGEFFDVSFTATPTAAGNYANPRTLGSCMVDPNNVVAEANENNNTCADTVTSNVLVSGIVLTASISRADRLALAEYVKPVIVAGPATLTIAPIPGATLAITYRKYLQPIQPTPTPTSSATSSTSSTSSSFSTSKSASTSTTTRSTTVTLSADDEIEWSTPSPTPTPTPSPSPTASPRRRAATTPTPTATPSVTPTATPPSH